MKLTHLDLFSGYGGFSLAMRNNGIKTIGFSEIDKYAIAVYEHNFQGVTNYGDIKSIQDTRISADIITFGSPCQDLSLAGKRRGLGGSRSGLFFEACKIINKNRPGSFIFENVKGLLSSNGGKDFDLILHEFTNIGYDCQWQLCDTSWFLPQSRERLFIVGHIRGKCRPQIFPIGKIQDGSYESAEKKPQTPITRTIDTRVGSTTHWGTYVVASRSWPRNGKNDTERQQRLEPRYDGLSNTLTSVEKDNMIQIGDKIRRLTPIECERLQGLPDNWTKEPGISDSQRYKMIGNGVSIPVVEEIVNRLTRSL